MNLKSYISTNFMIDHAVTGEYVPMVLNPVQDKYLSELINSYGEQFWENSCVRELIVKARKEGFTSLILAIFASVMAYLPQARNFLEISYRIDATKQHFRRMRNFFYSLVTHDTKKWDESLRSQLFSVYTEGSELVLSRNSASFYSGTATSSTGERGGTVQGVLFTESAHYPDTGIRKASEIIEGTKSMVAVDSGMVFQETTGNGWNHVKRTWDMAKAGEVDYKPRFFGWREFYTAEQFKKISDGFSDKSLIPQEFPETADEAFLYSGRPAFNPKQLAIYAKRVSDPLWIGEVVDDGHTVDLDINQAGQLKVWKSPRQGRRYIIAADVAEGVKGGAYSVAQVIDRSSWEQVAVWRGHIDPGNFGKKMCDIGYWYYNAILIPENNNHGWATMERIKAEGYPHLFKTSEIWSDKETVKDGFPTNEKTKNLIISATRNALDELTVHLNDLITVNELMSCVYDESGKVVTQEGYFMDTVMSLAIGIYCLKFLTVDETYREDHKEDSPMLVTSIVGKRREKMGYR